MAANSSVPCPPVALIVFNRPDCTAQVLERIREARPAKLFVIADGPRSGRVDDRENCRIVRKLIDDRVDWECEVTRLYSGTNMGCAARVASGLESVFDAVEEAVILEDDCVPDPTFFRFCGELLARYRDEPKVGMIAGTNFRDVLHAGAASHLFSSHYSVWGWATWQRAFSGFDPTMSAWRSSVHPADIAGNWSDSRSRRLHAVMFDTKREGAIDSWAVPWCLHLATRRQLSAVAGVNLVSNIGVEGTHTRIGDRIHGLGTGSMNFPVSFPDTIAADEAYNRQVASTHRLYRDWYRTLWAARLRRFFGSARR